MTKMTAMAHEEVRRVWPQGWARCGEGDLEPTCSVVEGPLFLALCLLFPGIFIWGNFLYMHGVAIHGNLSEGDLRTFVKTGCPSWMASQDPSGRAVVQPCLSTTTCGIQDRSPCLLFLSYTIWVDGRAPNLYSLFSELTTCPEGLSRCFERESFFMAGKTCDSQEVVQEF